MALGDLYEVVLTCEHEGNRAKNVFHYVRSVESSNGTNSLINAFTLNIIPAVQALMVASAHVAQLFVRNCFANTGFQEINYPAILYPGTWGAEAPLPDFVASTIVAPRQVLGMRPGIKRFAFHGEGASAANEWNGTFLGLLGDLAGECNSELILNGTTHTPAIVKRIKYTTSGGKTAYRLPATQQELQYYVPVYSARPEITSQATRKTYRNP